VDDSESNCPDLDEADPDDQDDTEHDSPSGRHHSGSSSLPDELGRSMRARSSSGVLSASGSLERRGSLAGALQSVKEAKASGRELRKSLRNRHGRHVGHMRTEVRESRTELGHTEAYASGL
jgi:hypothetical protein